MGDDELDTLRAICRKYAEARESENADWTATGFGFTIGDRHYEVVIRRDTEFEQAIKKGESGWLTQIN